MAYFIGQRRLVAYARMAPLSVIKNLDIFEYIFLGFLSGTVSPVMSLLGFQCMEEAFSRRISQQLPRRLILQMNALRLIVPW